LAGKTIRKADLSKMARGVKRKAPTPTSEEKGDKTCVHCKLEIYDINITAVMVSRLTGKSAIRRKPLAMTVWNGFTRTIHSSQSSTIVWWNRRLLLILVVEIHHCYLICLCFLGFAHHANNIP
jgi:hypothetical protein